MSEICVLGIFVADISFSGSKIPSIGETILGTKYNVGPGGKGSNQAICIARLGGKVNFFSKIDFTRSLKKKLPIEYKISAPIEIEITEIRVPSICPNNIPEIIRRGEPKPSNVIQMMAKTKK